MINMEKHYHLGNQGEENMGIFVLVLQLSSKFGNASKFKKNVQSLVLASFM